MMNTQLFAVVGIAITLALVGAVVTESIVLSQHADARGCTSKTAIFHSDGRCAGHGPL
jgi:hypothetical protein